MIQVKYYAWTLEQADVQMQPDLDRTELLLTIVRHLLMTCRILFFYSG